MAKKRYSNVKVSENLKAISGDNEYGNLILHKKYGIIPYLKFTRYLSKLRKHSPSYKELKAMATFIRVAKLIFFYTPGDKLDRSDMGLSEYRLDAQFKDDDVIISYFPKHHIKITITLSYLEDINIRIYNYDEEKEQTNVSFSDGNASIECLEDEQMFINIIRPLMDGFCTILEYYYNAKTE
jgi:hypothetical protein|nr:MAG TPA: hypothetical protein [Caudoviricetes sp.]